MKNINPMLQSDVVQQLFLNVGGVLPANKKFQRNVILAEYLRCSILGLSRIELGGKTSFEPVHIRRLINTVRNHLEAVWPHLRQDNKSLPFNTVGSENDTYRVDSIQWVLKNLALIGDVVNLGNGYWIPSPVRLIKFPFSEYVAVIGGVATAHLKGLFAGIKIAGHGRVLKYTDIPKYIQSGQEWWQDYHNWIGFIPDDLSSWTEVEVAKVRTNGSRSSPTFVDFEVCITNKKLRYKTRNFWVPAATLMVIEGVDEVLLCRTGKPIRYFLGEFTSGQLVHERTISSEIVRWLQLGLCLRGCTTPSAKWVGSKLKLFPVLPRSLKRYLTVYSNTLISETGQVVYHVPMLYQDQVKNFLEHFGYCNRN